MWAKWENYRAIFEVITPVRMMMTMFWVLTPCRLGGIYQCFGETCCFYLQGYLAGRKQPKKIFFISSAQIMFVNRPVLTCT
jgi:hypothetical protein